MTDCTCTSHPCARCCWQPQPDDQLADRLQLLEHANDAGHPLCTVCSRSLPDDARQTCTDCIKRNQTQLADIGAMYRELGAHLGHLRSASYDSDRPGATDGRPLPGGEVLVLLGRGSEGLAETGLTSKDGDPTSVAYELGWWANQWAEQRQEAEVVPLTVNALTRPWPASRQVDTALQYLDVLTRWAGQNHPGFAAYADDLRRLHRRLERATGRDTRPERAEAECFTCGADALIRKQTAKGLADEWTCARCGASYDWTRYLLACRARVDDGRQHLRQVGWGTVRQIAAAVGVSVNTAKAWAKRGTVTTSCSVQSQELLVWYPEADQRARRNRCRTEGHQFDPDLSLERAACLRCGAVLRDRKTG